MADLILEWNDPRIGTMVGGAPVVWPATDIHGQVYQQINATILRVAEGSFVVIGPDRGQAIERVIISQFAIPPVPEPPAILDAPLIDAPLEPPFPVDEVKPDDDHTA